MAVEHDQDTIQLLRAFINACVIGRPDLQRYMHLLGAGGTGKSTFIRLLFEILGNENCTTTDLKNLEENKFETANIYGKRLTAITDSNRYGSSVDVLKALTGQDPVRNERKNVQQAGSFIYEGMILIASNEALASTDYTSGIGRRQLVVKFDRRIKADEKTAFMAAGGEEQLHREIPAIIKWALQLSREKVTNIFMHPPAKASEAAFESLISQNPIMQWITENLLPCTESWHYIGVRKEIRTTGGTIEFEDADVNLYPNYSRWCYQNKREALAVRRFKDTTIDMLETLGWEEPKNKAKKNGGIYLSNIKIRQDFHAQHDWGNGVSGKK